MDIATVQVVRRIPAKQNAVATVVIRLARLACIYITIAAVGALTVFIISFATPVALSANSAPFSWTLIAVVLLLLIVALGFWIYARIKWHGTEKVKSEFKVLTYVGIIVLSGIVTVIGSAQTGLIVLFGTTCLALMLAWDRRYQELVASVRLPLLTNYYQVVEEGSPLFKLAAGDAYQRTLSAFGCLAKGELVTNQLDEVFHYLEFLFRDSHVIRKIRAISSGEFEKWAEHESWWSRQYLDLHEAAFNRGVDIERIFVVASKEQENSVQDVFRINAQHHVRVKVVLKSQINVSDWRAGNCLLFYDEHNEPLYGLLAYHDAQGGFKGAVIHEDEHNVRLLDHMYNRIEGVAHRVDVQVAA